MKERPAPLVRNTKTVLPRRTDPKQAHSAGSALLPCGAHHCAGRRAFRGGVAAVNYSLRRRPLLAGKPGQRRAMKNRMRARHQRQTLTRPACRSGIRGGRRGGAQLLIPLASFLACRRTRRTGDETRALVTRTWAGRPRKAQQLMEGAPIGVPSGLEAPFSAPRAAPGLLADSSAAQRASAAPPVPPRRCRRNLQGPASRQSATRDLMSNATPFVSFSFSKTRCVFELILRMRAHEC